MKKKLLPMYAVSMFLLNAFAYGLSSLYFNFSQTYIGQYVDTAQTGLLLSIGPLVAMAAPFFWGVLADRAKTRRSVFLIQVLGSAVGFTLFGMSDTFPTMALSLLLFMFFHSPIVSLTDLLTVEGCAATGIKYGLCRIAATIFYAVLPNLLIPYIDTGSADGMRIIFYAYIAIALLCTISVSLIPVSHRVKLPKAAGKPVDTVDKPVEDIDKPVDTADKSVDTVDKPVDTADKPVDAAAKSDGKRGFFRDFMHDKPLIMIICLMFIGNFTFGCVVNYYPAYLSGTLGLPGSVWTAVAAAAVTLEVPLFLFFDKMMNRIGIKRLLFISLVMSALRALSYFLLRDPTLIVISTALTGAGTTYTTYSNLTYITGHYERNHRSTALSLSYCIGMFGGRFLAGAAAGPFVGAFGFPALMLAVFALCICSFAFYIVFIRAVKGNPEIH